MITIRLQRRGRKNDPSFRVVVTENFRAPQSGKYLEMVGSYDPREDRVELKGERIKEWMSNGAQVSDTVHNLLVSAKVIEGKKINVLPKKTVAKVEEPAEEVKVAASAEGASEPMEAPAAQPEESAESPAETAVEEAAPAESAEETLVEETAPEETPAAE